MYCDQKQLFGNCRGTARCALNTYGIIAQNELQKTQRLRGNVLLGSYVIMPNHVHAIIGINEMGTARRARTEQFGSFKSAVTKRINELRNTIGCQVWQRNYYEHVIRDEQSHSRIIKYIEQNPIKWEEDKYYCEIT